MDIYVECPHCQGMVQISQINCGIFRHGVLKNGVQVDPHAPEEVCRNLFEKEQIYGCGKPFRLMNQNGKYQAVECGYI